MDDDEGKHGDEQGRRQGGVGCRKDCSGFESRARLPAPLQGFGTKSGSVEPGLGDLGSNPKDTGHTPQVHEAQEP